MCLAPRGPSGPGLRLLTLEDPPTPANLGATCTFPVPESIRRCLQDGRPHPNLLGVSGVWPPRRGLRDALCARQTAPGEHSHPQWLWGCTLPWRCLPNRGPPLPRAVPRDVGATRAASFRKAVRRLGLKPWIKVS